MNILDLRHYEPEYAMSVDLVLAKGLAISLLHKHRELCPGQPGRDAPRLRKMLFTHGRVWELELRRDLEKYTTLSGSVEVTRPRSASPEMPALVPTSVDSVVIDSGSATSTAACWTCASAVGAPGARECGRATERHRVAGEPNEATRSVVIAVVLGLRERQRAIGRIVDNIALQYSLSVEPL